MPDLVLSFYSDYGFLFFSSLAFQICLLMSMDDGTSIYQMVIIASYDCEIFFCLDDDLVFLMVGI